jgi:hypothetical protein
MRSSATFHREWGYLSGGRNLLRTLRIASIAAEAGALGGAGLVLAVGHAPEANTSVAARTLVTPEISPAAKPSDATAEAPQPPEYGSAAFHVVYSGELNRARNQENDKAIKSGTTKAATLQPPANEELARTPEPIIREKQPRRDQAVSNRGARPGVRPLREAQQPQTSGDQELHTTSRPVQQHDVEILRGDNRKTLGLMPLELMLPSLHHFSNLGELQRALVSAADMRIGF